MLEPASLARLRSLLLALPLLLPVALTAQGLVLNGRVTGPDSLPVADREVVISDAPRKDEARSSETTPRIRPRAVKTSHAR